MRFTSFVSLAILGGLTFAAPAAPSNEIQARDCSASIQAFNMERRAKRGHDKRAFWWDLRNSTCILSPSVKGADNWTEGAKVRTDITDGQQGLSLLMDVGVLDLSTCQPLNNALVEIWGANAAGQYGTFLRGANPTNSAGIAEMQTIVPGFTAGNALHLGVRVHPSWSGETAVNSNSAAYIGRVYLNDNWARVITGGVPAYQANPTTHTSTSQDPIWNQASAGGYSPILDIESIQDDWPAGVVGYITVGVNPNAKVTA